MKQYPLECPFERRAFHVAGPFPETNANIKYIVVVMNNFSKRAITVADGERTGSDGFELLLEIQSDQEFFKKLCDSLGLGKVQRYVLCPVI